MNEGLRIKKYRLEKGLTQKELAERCGLFDSAIRRYESGRQNPKKETLEKIATALEIPVTQLLFDGNIIFDDKVDPNAPPPTGEQIVEGLERFQEQLKELSDAVLDIYANSDEAILHYYNKLNHKGKKEALERVEELTEIPKYTTPDSDNNNDSE